MIGAGHALQDVRHYTRAQVEAFSEAIDKQDRSKNRVALIASRSAGIKPDSFKKILKEIG